MTEDETKRRERWEAELEQIRATISKLNDETAKMLTENRWYRFVVGSGVTLAIVALGRLVDLIGRQG